MRPLGACGLAALASGLGVALSPAVASAQARAGACALGTAVYRPAEGGAASTLRFVASRDAGSGSRFGFALTLGPRVSYRFKLTPSSGAADSYAEMAEGGGTAPATPSGRFATPSGRDPEDGDAPASPIHFFDERFRRAEPETLDDAAPAAVFLPELQRAFAYWSANPDPEIAPTGGMWVRDCGR
ncbi:hypothetical protein GCM10008171_02420 [Methylopila jiangsuensis]|uniref:Uncharacterized protein n=1 Tax=Methylopila jiangsuensis TaxID=586230 RepID=A0A9W6JEV0_9HYPH|nr:hypothetical protein [Methylopila jiangsuensis]MDR6287407.1 hypothetical protein [Methylopila jiangsuensis]GLK74988.1 hypothetical protein GCM10008171_02420 [Methylopila jiangsuensis]